MKPQIVIVFVMVSYQIFVLISYIINQKITLFFYIYGMREAIRNASFVHLWKYFYGNETWIEFELKLNMNLFRQRYQKGPKQNWSKLS